MTAEHMLLAAEAAWPRLRVTSALGDPPVAPEVLGADRFELILKTGGRLTVDRHDASACFTLPRRLSDVELIHPYLAPAAAVMAHWHGRLAFHAGGFVHDGGVWGIVGGRESGKSSTLAWLSAGGHGIVADDLLVLDGATAYAGPRSIDLRRDTAERLGLGDGLGVVGTRERWRITLAQLPGELPFRGWIFPSWSDAMTGVRRMAASECLARLKDNLGLLVPVADPARLLDLASMRAWELARPRDWDHMEESIRCMLSVATS